MSGELARRLALDLLFVTIEHVLLTLGDVEDGDRIAMIVAQARDLQDSLGEIWRRELEVISEDEMPF